MIPAPSDNLLSDLFRHHAKYSPRGVAVRCDDESLTWYQLERRTRKVANALAARGIAKGDKVGIFMTSSLFMFELLWGTVRSGAVVVPLNVMLSPDALARAADNAQLGLLFTDTENLPVAAEALAGIPSLGGAQGVLLAAGASSGYASAEAFVDAGGEQELAVRIEPQDSMCILYTSGTTGAPKGGEHSHLARLLYYAYGFARWLRFSRSTVTLCATPLYANGTWMTMLPTLYSGGTVVVIPKFSAQAFYTAVERERCTHVFLVPTQQVSLLADPLAKTADTRSLEVIYSAGQALLPAMYKALQEGFPHTAIYDCYGMSEGFGTIACPDDFAGGKSGTVGKPILLDDILVVGEDGRELPAGETGEIVGRSAGMMKGYYRDPERTGKALWQDPQGRTYIRSGDLGYFDEDGYLFICGRLKDMIKSGGIAVYASDIEAVFVQHPDVLEVAAIGIPHPKWLETPLLLARMKPGARVTQQELAEWGNGRLGKYQRVSAVEFREDFPRATYGKVQKDKLRAPYWQQA